VSGSRRVGPDADPETLHVEQRRAVEPAQVERFQVEDAASGGVCAVQLLEVPVEQEPVNALGPCPPADPVGSI
jgi:hypothetical protein